MSEESLLPSNATTQEIALDLATSRVGDVNVVGLRSLWNPATCPEALLPWLAWAMSIDEWDGSWDAERKRAVIAASVEVHRHKGTLASVRTALAAAGWGDATIVERWGSSTYDGALPRDGSATRAGVDHWAKYRVYLTRPITIAQAAAVRRQLAAVAPLRCHLDQLNYTEALHLYNGALPRDGTYARGVA